MPWSIIAPIAGSLLSAGAAGDAADTQAAAAGAATAEQRRQYDLTRSDALSQYNQVRADQQPYRTIGNSAIQRLAQGMGYAPTVPGIRASSQSTQVAPNEAQIRAELTPQYTQSGMVPTGSGDTWDGRYVPGQSTVNQAGLDAAVQARMQQPTNLTQGEDGVYTTDPNAAGFGSLSKNFTMADYQADPGYQFRLNQGQQGIQRAASARGGQYSGATLKALSRFNSDQASQEYGNAYSRFNTDQTTQFNRNASLAGVGQTANTAVGNAGNATQSILANTGINSAAQIGQGIQNAGAARASGYVGQSNALGEGIRGAYNNYSQNQAMNGFGTKPMGIAGTYSSGYVPDYNPVVGGY